MASGYAAACVERARPTASLPWATCACAASPCVHTAAASAPAWARVAPSHATVVNFRTVAPSAHCAK
eukprot:4340116-Pleurochrysis_carterae.AAC.1